jgi:hypothetical protein
MHLSQPFLATQGVPPISWTYALHTDSHSGLRPPHCLWHISHREHGCRERLVCMVTQLERLHRALPIRDPGLFVANWRILIAARDGRSRPQEEDRNFESPCQVQCLRHNVFLIGQLSYGLWPFYSSDQMSLRATRERPRAASQLLFCGHILLLMLPELLCPVHRSQ